ncbi:hypothetical protein GCM10010109_53180 [Actinoplanes campanulatus]|nr:hypothetical protein GCM10010109_53180 [Actinoplanes campanulatus]GID40047.1 hypothetical protein Aca09nite_65530 [Actinoplanes campanulatus]
MTPPASSAATHSARPAGRPGRSTPGAWQARQLPPTRRKWQHMRGCPTDLRPAGAAQAGAGSKLAPSGRNGPDGAGRGHAYKKKRVGSETRTETHEGARGRALMVIEWHR